MYIHILLPYRFGSSLNPASQAQVVRSVASDGAVEFSSLKQALPLEGYAPPACSQPLAGTLPHEGPASSTVRRRWARSTKKLLW